MPHRLAAVRPSRRRLRLLSAWLAGVIAIAIIGWIDFATGAELRVFPLYYLPISLLAWQTGRLESMLSRADSTMYAAKAEGRNRLRLEVHGGSEG